MRVRFPYLHKGTQWFPVVEIGLHGRSGAVVTFKALVDSGASFSVFRPEVAEALGVGVERGIPVTIEGISGRILGYRHRLPAVVAGHRFTLIVIFSRELAVSFNLLGRANFFQNFRVTFDEAERAITLER